ncbi:expressed unknown protein [Seminavis robusta]|uniref:Uncharacterized protein n=1 Tax=Seminavis robusta TaxID=568900 RepID=A0A9N8HW59_9STRA|nr:expressed unknown protein [Seminavis robusta]|eukprot:Sro1603_g285270.1 n/a (153) ;mRNA; r:4605-5063
METTVPLSATGHLATLEHSIFCNGVLSFLDRTSIRTLMYMSDFCDHYELPMYFCRLHGSRKGVLHSFAKEEEENQTLETKVAREINEDPLWKDLSHSRRILCMDCVMQFHRYYRCNFCHKLDEASKFETTCPDCNQKPVLHVAFAKDKSGTK